MCFIWIWEITAIISLYSINWLVFMTETECVYSAVRTGSLNIIQVNLVCKGELLLISKSPQFWSPVSCEYRTVTSLRATIVIFKSSPVIVLGWYFNLISQKLKYKFSALWISSICNSGDLFVRQAGYRFEIIVSVYTSFVRKVLRLI
jgi:hypothetical protein